MMNQLVLVGRLANELELKKSENGKTFCYIQLAVNRSFKNIDGIYETDIIPCILWDTVANHSVEYLQKGDVIGIKGRIQMNDDNIEIIAEKVTFLSNRK